MTAPRKLLPDWISAYPKQALGADVLAGVIVAVLVVPQSLAYALLAGLPPQAGLYASIFPVMAYALLGSSRVQAVGPVAITAIMTFATLAPLAPMAPPGSAQYVLLAATLALISGGLLFAAGLLRLGFLSQLLSRPVMSGFISGSAVLIVISQLKHVLGLKPQGSTSWEVALDLLRTIALHAERIHLPTLALGVASLLALLLVPLIAKNALPVALGRAGLTTNIAAHANFAARLMPLLIVAAGGAATVVWDLDQQLGVAVVGNVAAGLPGFSFFLPGMDTLKTLLVPALVMALVGMVQGISMAQALAIKRRERIDANAELVGLGASNIVAAFYGGMPVGGGVSRSAVNVAAGAQTPLASMVSALAMIAIVAGAASWFERVPIAVLAACIIVAAYSMIDTAALRQAWAYDRADALALLGTALGVLVFGLEVGIGVGVMLSMAALLFRASSPHIAVIGRIAGTEHFRNVTRYAVETLPGVLFIRIDEALFFGNLAAVEQRLKDELDIAHDVQDIHDVVLVMSAVNQMDATAVEVLTELNRDLDGRSIKLHLAEVKGPIQDRLMRTQLWAGLSGAKFLSAHEAFVQLSAGLAAIQMQQGNKNRLEK